MTGRLPRMSRQRFILIGILFFHSVNTYMDRACIASAVDYIKRDLSVSAEMMGLMLGIFAVGYALFQVPSGWIADRLGPRRALTIVVSVWSVFTALSGAARTAFQMLVLRFLFGVGEAGAFPGAAQAFFRWLPVRDRGLAHGINFSGSRLGAAFSLFFMPWLILQIGWRWTFAVNGLIGILWAIIWLLWFRDNPRDNPKVNPQELDYIEKGRASDFTTTVKSSFAQVFTSLNMGLAMVQYFASNVTFFISLTWLPSYLKNQWPDDPRTVYWSAVPLIFAAFANWVAGAMVTQLYKRGMPVGSRRITAVVGFALGVVGLLLATQTENLHLFVLSFSLATFGVNMTLSPSWAFCFQYEAWQRIHEVTIAAMCNRDPGRAQTIMETFGIENHYTGYREMLEKERPDFVDIVTPPPTHLEMCRIAADLGIHIICQKPLAPTLEEAKQIVDCTGKADIRFMVHENWRFQPWYREIRHLLDAGAIGEKIHVMAFRSRMGDGWGQDAYLGRQPYFRDYPHLLVYENGVHFIDTYRYLGGRSRASTRCSRNSIR
ncbi:MAG TPA: MFS transporter [Sedimentisphaerales bacterium]|nr:MFS transporter [Sedimentisphaerales bacterium]